MAVYIPESAIYWYIPDKKQVSAKRSGIKRPGMRRPATTNSKGAAGGRAFCVNPYYF